MSMVMFRCPRTKRAIPTGLQVDRATFQSAPVFFSQTFCLYCHATHEWFAKDAWVCDCVVGDCDFDCQQRAA
jgi:hypothetical protein